MAVTILAVFCLLYSVKSLSLQEPINAKNVGILAAEISITATQNSTTAKLAEGDPSFRIKRDARSICWNTIRSLMKKHGISTHSTGQVVFGLSASKVDDPSIKVNVASRCDGEKSPKSSTRSSGQVPMYVIGTSIGLPGEGRNMFADDNLEVMLHGENRLEPISDTGIKDMLEKNVVQLKRRPDGQPHERLPVTSKAEAIKVSARMGNLDMSKYGLKSSVVATMDSGTRAAVAAGLEALRSAGLVSGATTNPEDWRLHPALRAGTAVIYATSFPAHEALASEIMRYYKYSSTTSADASTLLDFLTVCIETASPEGLSSSEQKCFAQMRDLVNSKLLSSKSASPDQGYEFDRKFLFRTLCLANTQLAEIVKAHGPNLQTNAACAGTTQAVALAHDMLMTGRAERVVVIAGDNASGSTLMPWIGNGFRALGASSIAETPEEVGLPFDRRRNGMVVGAGAVGIVLANTKGQLERLCLTQSTPLPWGKCRLLATRVSNSAYHGASMDRKHIAQELRALLDQLEKDYGVTRDRLVHEGVYISHETSTNASPQHACSANEVYALRQCFGEKLSQQLLILNTKGFFGHPMGVSFEDVLAIEVLHKGVIPPIPNHKKQDEYLGTLNLSKGGNFPATFALRFAAGFGSQIAFTVYCK